MLEYGSGASTVFFSQFVKEWWSIEHSIKWADETRRELENVKHKDNVALEVIEPDVTYQRRVGSNMNRRVDRNGRFRKGRTNDGTLKEFK